MDTPNSSLEIPNLLALRDPKFSFNDSTYSLVLSSLADTLSSNCSVTTFSSSETIPGPGSLSGKAILALGKATLRGAEKLIIWRRVQAINARFPHYNEDEFPGAERVYEDVLELSRRDMYPDVLRSRALKIILVQIGSRQTDLLLKTLTTWAHTEVEILISDLTDILNPLRLFTTERIGELSDQARAYQASLAAWESHTLGPIILFFRQLARHSLRNSGTQISRIIMEGSAMDFLLHLYHSNFTDPFRDPTPSVYDGRQPFHHLCETLLTACSRVDQGRYNGHHRHTFHALWSMERQYLSMEPANTLIERLEILKLMKPEYVVSLIRLIFHMMHDWDGFVERNSDGVHNKIAADLIELSGLSSAVPEISYLALIALRRFVSFRGEDTKEAFRQYFASEAADSLPGLMSCIFERISQVITMNTVNWDTFISRWYEPNFGPVDQPLSGAGGMLEIIDCFVEVAENNPAFLDTIIEANMLGLLRPFLEVELRTTPLHIAKHEGDALMAYADSDMRILYLIGQKGLLSIAPYSRVRTILDRAFEILLQRLKEVSFLDF